MIERAAAKREKKLSVKQFFFLFVLLFFCFQANGRARRNLKRHIFYIVYIVGIVVEIIGSLGFPLKYFTGSLLIRILVRVSHLWIFIIG